MHDPMVMVFSLGVPIPRTKWKRAAVQPRWGARRRRYTCPRDESPLCGEAIHPWWRPAAWELFLAGRDIGWTEVVDVWHAEPDGRDSGTVCKGMGGTELTWANVRWAWAHRRHLDIRWLHWQRTRNWLFLRCTRCGQPFRGAHRARIGRWNGDARDVRHRDCDLIEDQQRQLRLLADWITTGRDGFIARRIVEQYADGPTPFAETVEDQ